MTIYTRQIVYPEGDTQEIEHALRVNQVVDLNGSPLALPLPTVRMIAFRVYKVSTHESIGETITLYHLELLTRDQMIEYT